MFSRPGILGTHATMGADLSFLLSVLFTIIFLFAWHMGRRHKSRMHHYLNLMGTGLMFVYFVFYYLAKGLGVLALEGKTGFGGPDIIYTWFFVPVLTVHILAVTVGIILGPYMVILGFLASQRIGQGFILADREIKISRTWFFRILIGAGFIFGAIFLVRSAMDGFSLRRFLVYLSGISFIIVGVGVERLLETWLPKGDRRHRFLGSVVMVTYTVILITSAMTYLLLYVLYQPVITHLTIYG